MPYIFRKATTNDTHKIASIHTTNWQSIHLNSPHFLNCLVEQDRYNYWLKALSCPQPDQKLMIVAVQIESNQVVGFAGFRVSGDSFWVESLHVDSDYRGAALGSNMFKVDFREVLFKVAHQR
eukprot:TRINITY_DN4807_c0_g1_i2.p1 TRINITY_DN4807_c0_g1~~TRINITY_DN4807_c0_g1_i2.p1  ORF type:complete len:122 (-),score=13.74 TRINITY_DN4807_c0_g1_i2:107-472(-)